VLKHRASLQKEPMPCRPMPLLAQLQACRCVCGARREGQAEASDLAAGECLLRRQRQVHTSHAELTLAWPGLAWPGLAWQSNA